MPDESLQKIIHFQILNQNVNIQNGIIKEELECAGDHNFHLELISETFGDDHHEFSFVIPCG